jgi:hypothetical protein
VVFFWIAVELDCLDVFASFKHRFHDSVHAVHYGTISGQDDWIGEVSILFRIDGQLYQRAFWIGARWGQSRSDDYTGAYRVAFLESNQ